MADKLVLSVVILILLNWISCDAASGGTRDQVNRQDSLLLLRQACVAFTDRSGEFQSATVESAYIETSTCHLR